MKKFIYSSVVIVSFTFYSAYINYFSQNTDLSVPTAVSQPIVVPIPATQATPPVVNKTPAITPAPIKIPPVQTSPPPPVVKPKGMYNDGQYTGSPADAYYGTVQVQATISGGKITDVAFLQYPNDRNHSININRQAMPYLTSEAIAAQNANVDIVSGATDTSQAFQQSLASALAKAKN